MRSLTCRLMPGLMLAGLATFLLVPAMAETLQCRSINGNVTCAGSGAASCQTVNGRTTCVSGGGGVVQHFGSARSAASGAAADEAVDHEAERREADDPVSRRGLAIERRGPGAALSLQREGTRLRLRTERLAVDID